MREGGAIAASRRRMLDAFTFSGPDRIPVYYHPSPAGLHTHGEKLLDLFRAYAPDNAIAFDSVPSPSEGTVDAEGNYRELRRDEWGTLWEHAIFGVWGLPKEYPFASWAAARGYELPPLPAAEGPDFERERAEVAKLKARHLIFRGGPSLFEKLHSLRPIDDVLVDLATGDPDLIGFIDRLAGWWERVLERELALGSEVVMFGDDWGTQTGQMISTELFREVFRPRLARLMGRVKDAGARVLYHSCGLLEGILDELFEMGIDCLWHQVGLYETRPFAECCRDAGVAVFIHPDRQYLVPRGTPGEIDARIAEYAELYREMRGGGIFYVEIENDAPFGNVRALVEAIDRHR